MSLLHSLARLVKDPPPEHAFELSEAGLAYAHGAHTGFEKFPPPAPRGSPSEDNLVNVETMARTIAAVAPPNGAKKRRAAAILLPDASARVSVLDFDSFPDAAPEQASLVRFRVKKTIPFDIDSAQVSYYRQAGLNRRGKIEVVAVTVALDVLARYETLFRGAGFHPGDITISALSALSLYRDDEPAVIAKLAGSALTVMVVAAGKLKLFRCVTLDGTPSGTPDGTQHDINAEPDPEEVRRVLYPTFAYAEDELGAPVKRLILCGFPHVPQNLPAPAEPLRSRFGAPEAFNAGLYGYLEAVG
jgi:type IV pilus assembly protein PilM